MRLARARLRVGRPVRATAGASALRAEVPWRGSPARGRLSRRSPSHRRGPTLLRRRALHARSSTCSPSRRAWAARCPWRLRCSAPTKRARPAHPQPCWHHGGMPMARSVVLAKPWVGVRWRDLCGAEERRAGEAARAVGDASATHCLSSERSGAASAAYAAARGRVCVAALDARAPQGSRRAAPTAASRATPHTHPRLCSLSRQEA